MSVEKSTNYQMCRTENKENGEDGKERVLFIAGVGVTCLVQSNIFGAFKVTFVGDVLKND